MRDRHLKYLLVLHAVTVLIALGIALLLAPGGKLRLTVRTLLILADRVAVMDQGMIQQLASPEDIYDSPANLFVAGFIGSPAMNLIEGGTNNGGCEAEGLQVPNIGGGTRNGLVLGIRPEDLTVVEAGQGDFGAPAYATELTGESVLVAVTAGCQSIAACGQRHMRKAIGEMVGISVKTEHAHLFDCATEKCLE